MLEMRPALPDPVPLVGGAFLRARPLVVAPMVLLSAVATARAGVGRGQLAVLAAVQGGMVAFFFAEAWALRGRVVTARWLAWSLALTVAGLGAAAAVSGGLDSPLLPLLLAPAGVAFGAFGGGRRALAVQGGVAAVLAVCAALPAGWPWPPVEPRRWMAGVCLAGALALLRLGVAALSDAHREALRSLHRVSEGALEEAAVRMRSLDALGARVAHEVKNPLASIKGLAALLAEGEAEPRRQRRFGVLLGEVDRVEGILGDYLSFARPIEGLRAAPTALRGLCERAVEVVEARARAQGTALAIEGEDLTAQVDARRLFEALMNLLTNALEAGATRVEVGWRRSGAGLDLWVRDDGRGLSREALARVGTPFFTSREGGTGLGVALARAAARQHGGELRYESDEGRGTRAVIELPRGVLHGDDRSGG